VPGGCLATGRELLVTVEIGGVLARPKPVEERAFGVQQGASRSPWLLCNHSG